jgi:Fe-S-cluster containining protein
MGYPAFNLSLNQLVQAGSGEAIQRDGLGPAAAADLDRWIAMPETLRNALLETMKVYRAPKSGELDKACVWLDPKTRLCQNHLHRPQVCRDFEIGCQECLDWREHYRDQVES